MEGSGDLGSWIRDEHPGPIFENLVSVFWFNNTLVFNAKPDPGSYQTRSGIRDGEKRFRDTWIRDPGLTSWIRNTENLEGIRCKGFLIYETLINLLIKKETFPQIYCELFPYKFPIT
jgi:hypothetical protein